MQQNEGESLKRQEFRKLILIVSFFLFPVTINYLSPYLIIKGASNGIASGSLIVFSFLFLSSLLVGRLWCGWLCPGGGCQLLLMPVNKQNAKGGRYNLTKYVIWTIWISAIAILAVMAGGFKVVDFFYMSESVVSVDSLYKYFIYYTVLAVFALLAITLGKRAACHYICWMAPFMIIGRKIRNLLKYPSLRLRKDENKCIDCKKCNKICPMSIDVNTMIHSQTMENTECILCGECVDVCPKGVIGYSFSSGNE
ncbi:polyferredoxin [Methanohalophilus levihalophilus]|uniref:4Fe-4S binding protein n=1 Tax=Methanohalophilus levihalophilus TaxID=1431282 RepID=UPI001AE38B0C|nr:4Fe-4S dicluster domain-containing protein [Methanohalophilus levihalophilus]MBP2031258.1 polyferredoxin [Methanohalophilus levihalophilus]